jgi:hypothetical protein
MMRQRRMLRPRHRTNPAPRRLPVHCFKRNPRGYAGARPELHVSRRDARSPHFVLPSHPQAVGLLVSSRAVERGRPAAE